MSANQVRVRFAPSPTGLLHVGNARTALYNWLYARHHGGQFLLRIEDTDLDRSEVRHETQLMEDLRWMGLEWDEGPGVEGPHAPYRQSERLGIYREHTERLLAEGKAYRCFCTQEDLEAERARAVAEHRPQVYSGRCRALSAETSAQRAAAGEPFAVRLRIPDHPLRFHDLVRGEVEFPQETVSDPILVRSSGMPVYNYVVTVDDALMEITHVIRGDDHISNTPKQVAIYEAFGWPVPQFAHLSTILGSDRERLSKRHGATSIASFREMGILPEALTNYLALLGWGAEGGTRETFTMPELVEAFKLERVTASPAVFDFEKLHWMNRHYLKLAEPARVAELAWPYFAQAGWLAPHSESSEAAQTWFEKLLAIFVPSVDLLDQLPGKARFVFEFDPAQARANEENAALLNTESAQKVLAAFAAKVRAHTGTVTPELFKIWMNEVKAETGAKGKDLFHPVRILLTGAHSGPEFDKLIPLFEEGSGLDLPVRVLSVRERVEKFLAE
ncbi:MULTISPECIES: glutamate--tRNA ligase [Acidobacterium]|uniref:Glutamate--tRNA ligase n=1 Tax=Acidobacterium capsulatum (strain ATCC 51196 / DSM 11244 / BCRC 80197 / JCM 7670 / NBRC 15755 / NCIMB 13165 / 161) TaxID=240015 RepID=C1F3W8_ACIC5|nr:MULTISPECIES: glutamate--tRNA ligase [Acidobacterium]ACO33990.1 glutamate--tRNA ligase [Acidobacterium capsulatum ATCC 51196]HCT60509.1 glutamate--tRNA ligase [Acidobacterium sp.]